MRLGLLPSAAVNPIPSSRSSHSLFVMGERMCPTSSPGLHRPGCERVRCCGEKDGEEEGGGRKDRSCCTLAGDTGEPELVIPTNTSSKASWWYRIYANYTPGRGKIVLRNQK